MTATARPSILGRIRSSALFTLLLPSLSALFLLPPTASGDPSPARALWHYDGGGGVALAASPAAVETYRIRPLTRALAEAPSSLAIELFDGRRLILRRTRVERRGQGSLTWRGEASDSLTGRAILTLEQGVLAGLIYAGDEVYEIAALPGGGHGVSLLEARHFGGCELEENGAGLSHAASAPAGGLNSLAGDLGPLAAGATGQESGDRFDMLVLYTSQARDAAGGVAGIEAMIQSAVDVANTAFQDSSVNPRLNLVHTALAAHGDSGSMAADLTWVYQDPVVAALRDQVKADVVSLIVDDGGGSCGRAFLMQNPDAGFAPLAFQITARSCAVGNLSFAHETGHVMGMEHDRDNGAAPSAASYPWSFGHWVSGSFRTVMSYSSSCSGGCARVPHFSNPAVSYNGSPTGVAGIADNHATANSTALTVANFRVNLVGGGGALFSDGFESGLGSWSQVLP